MTELKDSTIAQRLAQRVRAVKPAAERVNFRDEPVPQGLAAYLRGHLSAGDTHYTTRPGIVDLRRAIGLEIGRCGGPDVAADGVVVTHGEGEALFVTLLGLGIGAGDSVVVAGDCRHRRLFDVMGIDLVEPGDSRASRAVATYRQIENGVGAAATHEDAERAERQEILALGGLLFSRRAGDAEPAGFSTQAIVIGQLDSLPGMGHFQVGCAAGPPALVKRIMTWKQAFSICSAAPSQRAALFAISRERPS
jgi:hypothetical protein